MYPYNPLNEDIDIREDVFSVRELLKKFNNGKILLDPKNENWDNKQKSKYIESFVLNFPLASFYVQQTVIGEYKILDGTNRIQCLVQFLKNELQLSDLESVQELNGQTLNDINPVFKTWIEDRKLRVNVIKPSVPPIVVNDILSRI